MVLLVITVILGVRAAVILTYYLFHNLPLEGIFSESDNFFHTDSDVLLMIVSLNFVDMSVCYFCQFASDFSCHLFVLCSPHS